MSKQCFTSCGQDHINRHGYEPLSLALSLFLSLQGLQQPQNPINKLTSSVILISALACGFYMLEMLIRDGHKENAKLIMSDV